MIPWRKPLPGYALVFLALFAFSSFWMKAPLLIDGLPVAYGLLLTVADMQGPKQGCLSEGEEVVRDAGCR